jgi:hypothetical protein
VGEAWNTYRILMGKLLESNHMEDWEEAGKIILKCVIRN